MINFPSSPTIGQTFTSAGDTWTWDGVKWTGGGAAAAVDADDIPEAPPGGLQYGRVNTGTTGAPNGVWSPITATTVGIADVTSGGQYVRVAGAWQPLILPPTGIGEAPASGGPYGRQSSNWLQLGVLATAADAPPGASLYGRLNGAWAVVPPAGIADVTASGGPYCRIPGGWVAVPASTGITDAPSGGPWARTAGSWVTIAATTGTYLPLSGGSLSGPLILSDGSTAASQNWVLANTSTGAGFLPLSGGVMTGQLVNNASIVISGPNGSNRVLYGGTSGTFRWGLVLGSSAGESGNSGSNFQLTSYSSTGSLLAQALTVERASSAVTINAVGAPASAGGYTVGHANFSLNKNGSGHSCNINGYNNGSLRWQMALGDTTAEGGNAGSYFSISAFSDVGGLIWNPLKILRTTGQTQFSTAIQNGPSDRRLKENIAPLEGSLEKVLALHGVSFNMIATPEKREIGLIAQDVEPIVPEIIQQIADTDKLGLDYPKLTALLIEAVKTLSARVAALEAAR